MSKLKKIFSIKDIILYTKIFNRAIGYSNVPWRYHATGSIYAMFDNRNRIIGGFILIPGYWHLRSILQLPEEVQRSFFQENPKIVKSLCDLTGYFILNPKHGLKLTIWMVLITLFNKQKYFIYTYPTHDFALEKYYGYGKPIRVHTGVPKKLEGHPDYMEEEHVEILTKLGIIKIFIYRTKRIWKTRKAS